jgi:nucleoside-diphosphate-sugar epimerase
MRVFVTGATGWVGTPTVRLLKDAGHTVLGLARSDANAEALAQAGAEVHRGELADVDSLVAGARACDGVIHTAFIHDFTQFAANIETDRRAVEAMVGALEGSDKPMVIASGTMMVQHAHPATEKDKPASPDAPRAASEYRVLGAADRGVRGAVVRLPPTVHGAGDHGFMTWLIDIARRKGFSGYVGDGGNRWPAVHRLDAASVFHLALEKAPPGSVFHAAAEEGVPIRAVAETIGAGLGLPVRSITQDEAGAHFEFLSLFIGADNTTSSAITRETLGWSPKGPGLLEDLRDAGYV